MQETRTMEAPSSYRLLLVVFFHGVLSDPVDGGNMFLRNLRLFSELPGVTNQKTEFFEA
jgi:hypothetical protein